MIFRILAFIFYMGSALKIKIIYNYRFLFFIKIISMFFFSGSSII